MRFLLLVVGRDLGIDLLTYEDIHAALDQMKVHMDRPGVISVKLYTGEWRQIISLDRGGAAILAPVGPMRRG